MIESVLVLDANTRVVLNRISVDSDEMHLLNLPAGQMLSPLHDGDIGWTLTEDLQWINPNPPIPYPKDIRARFIRDNLLEKSDVYMIPDFPITELVREQWRQYRQDLRNLPQQPGFPETIVWPTKPE